MTSKSGAAASISRTTIPQHRSATWRERLGLGDRFTFVYVGRLAAEKRVEHIRSRVCDRASRLPGDSTRLVIAGAGPQEPALRASAPSGTISLGYLDRRTELPMLYASSDAFVFGSLTETLGLVVLEAMASGLPVIAVPAGGVADHLHHGVNGLAVPGNRRPGDGSSHGDDRQQPRPDVPPRRGCARDGRGAELGP